MSRIIEILNFEEGYKEKPYIDTQGYPTVAGGIKIGPKGAKLSNYTFTVPLDYNVNLFIRHFPAVALLFPCLVVGQNLPQRAVRHVVNLSTVKPDRNHPVT
jgi:hypothetical protein